ncbi:hypothetical protein AB0K00_20155 [Dactylosporangium sp. NPDC049525]|uniref:hypothetical protein n=1 Tax=Dactylosporangium sp. NPDC049525 TaxID=3154730 RepID=UPI00341AFB5D
MPGTTAYQYGNGETATTAYEGPTYGSISTTLSGGGIYQDKAVAVAAGDTFCASAEVVTAGAGNGSITLTVHLIGGVTESSSKQLVGVPGNNGWTPISACVTATGAHTTVRTQFYPGVNGPAMGIDAVDMHASKAKNGGFNIGGTDWSVGTGGTLTTYGAGVTGNDPFEGARFGAVTGAPVYQEFTVSPSGFEDYCASAYVASYGNSTGAGGSLVVSLITNHFPFPIVTTSQKDFTSLPGGNNWTQVEACASSVKLYDKVRVEIVPAAGTPPLLVDAVDLHPVLDAQSGMNGATHLWNTAAPAFLGLVTGSAAYEGGQSGAVSGVGGAVYQSIELPNDTDVCVSARVSAHTASSSVTMTARQLGQSTASSSKGASLTAPWRPLELCFRLYGHFPQRVGFEIASGTTRVDVVDVHASLVTNGGMSLIRPN